MYSGDEVYGEDVTSGLDEVDLPVWRRHPSRGEKANETVQVIGVCPKHQIQFSTIDGTCSRCRVEEEE